MPSTTIERLLDQLEELKRQPQARAKLRKLLKRLARRRFTDAASLIRFHESLLFLRAYPPDSDTLREVEEILAPFAGRVEKLRAIEADLSEFTDPQVSGISGTGFSAIFGYDITKHLAHRHPSQVQFDWDGYDNQSRFAEICQRFMPLLEEDAYVESYYPHLEWLRAAAGPKQSEFVWLVNRFEQLSLSDKDKAALFDSLKLWTHWEFGDAASSRTHMRRKVREVFYHDGPLLKRSDVSLDDEMKSPPLALRKLSTVEAQSFLSMGRDAMAARYRELHGFTFGDPRTLLCAEAGRGVEIFVWGVPPGRRLPMLAYHAVMILKNGVPISYAEGLSLFERVEIGINLFYTFRDGESAWIYARLMRLFRQLLGVEVFSVDPYQLGHLNDEGIESGAFWFYRKLGFRPIQPELLKLVRHEEDKMRARAGYRTSAQTLRRLSSGHVIYETPQTAQGHWDRFHVRNIGLAVQRRMGRCFDGDPQKFRLSSETAIARTLDAKTEKWNEAERRVFSDFSLTLSLIPDLARWTIDEKSAMLRIMKAKASADEKLYLRLLRNHARLRREIIKLGSSV